MKKTLRRMLILFTAVLFLPGCIRQIPLLSGTPTPRHTPTPTAPAHTPEAGVPSPDVERDALGKRIHGNEHFLRYYVLFKELRVYEFGGDTLLDGKCANLYPETLTGAFEIVFADDAGQELARAPILTGSGENRFEPGDTFVYAQIDTDMDIQLAPFEIVTAERVWPAP